MIREQPCYRRDAFMDGLKAAGYEARSGAPRDTKPGDILVTWNRYAEWHDIATRFESQGGSVVVAENGYLGPGGVSPHQMEPREWYALALGGHNGSGVWIGGGSERWEALNVDLKPWRTSGEHVLVCPNRPMGRPNLIMPLGWAENVRKRLEPLTDRPIRVRPHPGNGAHKTPLEADLEGAWACVIWSSSAGVQALIRGVPVIHECPYWICDGAASMKIRDVGKPVMNDRLDALHAMSWAQWHVSEIASGEAFKQLLQAA